MENELFEKLGKLHLVINHIEVLKRQTERIYNKADKLTIEITKLEQRILANKDTLPDFCLHSPVSNGR